MAKLLNIKFFKPTFGLWVNDFLPKKVAFVGDKKSNEIFFDFLKPIYKDNLLLNLDGFDKYEKMNEHGYTNLDTLHNDNFITVQTGNSNVFNTCFQFTTLESFKTNKFVKNNQIERTYVNFNLQRWKFFLQYTYLNPMSTPNNWTTLSFFGVDSKSDNKLNVLFLKKF